MSRMSPSLRHLALPAAAQLGAALFLSACATSPRPAESIPRLRNSPDGQITMISCRPAARCVRKINESVELQFRFAVPEAPCQIFARLDLPDHYSELAAHGFTAGSSACPSLLSGHGILKQGFTLHYDPKRDEHGRDDTSFPALARTTNLIFTVYPGMIGGDADHPRFIRNDFGRRTIYSVPVDITWICKKSPFLDYRRAQEIAEWNEVKALYPDAVLPEPPAKKSRAKKADVKNKPGTAEP
jgi:hypothetical protein